MTNTELIAMAHHVADACDSEYRKCKTCGHAGLLLALARYTIQELLKKLEATE